MSVSTLRNAAAAALAADHGSAVNFEALLQQLDEQFAALKPRVIERFQFDLDGITVELRRIRQKTGHRFLISASLGYLPFSIESADRREAIREIVLAAQRLPNVHFAIDHASKISAGGLFDVPQIVAPDFIFYPLTLFWQEARPFMRLIGQYL